MRLTDDDDESDDALAARAARGDDAAFDLLARRYQVPLLRFLARLCERRADAEDALQETLCRLHQRRASFDPARGSFRAWAFTVARRARVDLLRRTRNGPRLVGDAAERFEDDARDAADAADAAADGAALWALARRVLTRGQYEALWLHCAESLTAREVAAATGRSWVSTKAALWRAQTTLRAAALAREPKGQGSPA